MKRNSICEFVLVVVLLTAAGAVSDMIAGDDRKLDRTVEPTPNLPSSNVQVHYNDSASYPAVPNSCDCECGIPNRKERIVGGHVTKVNEFPWIVALIKRGTFYCAGSLVTRRHILTAAHCAHGFNVKDIRAVLGEHDRVSKTETVTVEKRLVSAKVYTNFSLSTFNNDIAIMELDSPVEFGDSIRPACLPTYAEKNYTGRIAIVAGWGRTEENKPVSSALRKVAVPVMSREECLKAGYAKSRITKNMICAGFPEGKRDACQGDSGGPLQIDGEQGTMETIGIVSWGRGCARPNYPGVYTRVANYVDWIHEQIGDECLCSPHST